MKRAERMTPYTEPDVRPLTPAQQKWLARLYENFQAAQMALNDFTRYLMEEHEIPDDGCWEIAPDLGGFVRTEEGGRGTERDAEGMKDESKTPNLTTP